MFSNISGEAGTTVQNVGDATISPVNVTSEVSVEQIGKTELGDDVKVKLEQPKVVTMIPAAQSDPGLIHTGTPSAAIV